MHRDVSYTSLSDLSREEVYNLAMDLSLASLTGEGVFNFGEIVPPPRAVRLTPAPRPPLALILSISPLC